MLISERPGGPPLVRRIGGMIAVVFGLAAGAPAGPVALPGDGPRTGGIAQFAGRCVTEAGTLLRREEPGKPWQILGAGDAVNAGELILGLPGGAMDAQDRAVRLTFLGDITGESPYPIVETAVYLHEPRGADMDVTLDRGRVDLVNRRKDGSARVRFRVRQETWDLTLEDGARIALETYGRWAPGVPFTRQPGPKDVPTADLVFLVIRGRVLLRHAGRDVALSAPPGPALIEWDSVTGMDASPRRLDALPAWAKPGEVDSALLRRRKVGLEQFRRVMLSKSIDAAIDEALRSEDPTVRRRGVFALGALDELARLGQVLREAKHPDVWDDAVLALRHWIGRGPGQDQLLYRGLMARAGYSPVEAETVLQLLHSYGETDLARPETYETLIDYLGHDRLAVRGLAYWHLIRLVPAGKQIGYDPYAPKEQREAAIREWRKLIPPGKMPPKSGTVGAK